MAAFLAPAVKSLPAAFRAHSRAETYLFFPASFVGLERAFSHDFTSLFVNFA